MGQFIQAVEIDYIDDFLEKYRCQSGRKAQDNREDHGSCASGNALNKLRDKIGNHATNAYIFAQDFNV